MSLLSYSAIVRERKTKYCARSWYFQQKNCKHLRYGLCDLKGFITSPSTNYAHTTQVCNSYIIKGTGNELKGVVNVPRIDDVTLTSMMKVKLQSTSLIWQLGKLTEKRKTM